MAQESLVTCLVAFVQVLGRHGPSPDVVKNWPVIGQFSSVGSLGNKADAWLTAEFLSSLSTVQTASPLFTGRNAKLQLVS